MCNKNDHSHYRHSNDGMEINITKRNLNCAIQMIIQTAHFCSCVKTVQDITVARIGQAENVLWPYDFQIMFFKNLFTFFNCSKPIAAFKLLM